MKSSGWKWIAGVLILVIWLVAVVSYNFVPERVASHWGMDGEVNGYMDRFWGVFFLPILIGGLYPLMLLFLKLDPRRKEVNSFLTEFDKFTVVMVLFLGYLYGLVLVWNLGYRFSMMVAMIPAMAVLFWEVGTLISKAELNYTVGIRTPWTLASKEVWRKTNTLGGTMFKIVSIVSLAGLFDGQRAWMWMLIPMLGTSMGLVVYSAVIYFKKDF